MSIFDISVHDAEVAALDWDHDARTFEIQLILPGGRRASLVFNGAEYWDLGPIATQNIMFDVYEWRSHTEGAARRCAELRVPQVQAERILSGQIKLYELDPSVGLGGYVVASTARAKVEPDRTASGTTANKKAAPPKGDAAEN